MGKPFLCMGSGKYSVEHKDCLPNCAEISRGNKISGGTNILRTLKYWFPTGFFTK